MQSWAPSGPRLPADGGRPPAEETAGWSATAWALMVMEAALVLPLLSVWLAAPEGRVALGPIVGLAMLPLGYFAVRRVPIRGHAMHRWPVALGTAYALRLLVSLPLVLQAPPPAVAPPLWWLNWLLGAVLPAGLGYALWWRGASLAEAELTVDGVRNEFVLAGGGLFVMLAVIRDTAGIGPIASGFAVVGFLCAGLVAVGLARQHEAGLVPTPGSSALVAGSALLLLGGGVALVLALSPDLAGAVLTLLSNGVGLLLWLLMLPLLALFSWLQLRFPLPQDLSPMPADALPGEPPEHLRLPEWLVDLIAFAMGTLGLVALVMVAVVLVCLLLTLLQRTSWRVGGRTPVAVDHEGSPWEDARGLVAGLGGWLGRLAGRARGIGAWGRSSRVSDARAAYRAFLRWARQRDLPRATAETPGEFARRLAIALPGGADHYRLLTASYEYARYGDRPASEAEVARLCVSLDALAALDPQPSAPSP